MDLGIGRGDSSVARSPGPTTMKELEQAATIIRDLVEAARPLRGADLSLPWAKGGGCRHGSPATARWRSP